MTGKALEVKRMSHSGSQEKGRAGSPDARAPLWRIDRRVA
jgi:hypothetical protein